MCFGGWTDNTRNAVRAFLTRQTDMNDLILDIRGNGGGSDREWTQMVQYLTAEPLEWHRLFAMKTGALNLAVNSGYEPLEEQYICYTDDSWRERHPDVPADTFDGSPVKQPRNVKWIDRHPGEDVYKSRSA